jgi:hypothetical protein
MYKFPKAFPRSRSQNFIRVAVFDNGIRLTHIKDFRVATDISSEFIHKDEILQYLSKNTTVGVELVISDRIILCKSISSDKLSIRDIRSLAENTIGKQDIANTVCYELPLFKKVKSIVMCTLFLNPIIADVIQQFMRINNLLLGITCWPVWVVDSYFALFPGDSRKFGASLFTIESEKTLEIIVTNDDKFICYRRGNIETFNKAIEEQNTIRYIFQAHKINPNDVAIYHINNETINRFTSRSARCMRIISQSLNCNMIEFARIAHRISSCLCGLVFCLLSVCTVTKYIELRDIKEKIRDSQDVLKSVDKKIMDESNLWALLHGDYHKNYDFKKAIREQMREDRLERANKITLNVDKSSNTVSVDLCVHERKK